MREWLFINPDLTVYLHRHPEGEWVALDALTYARATASGFAESALYDEQGPRSAGRCRACSFDRL